MSQDSTSGNSTMGLLALCGIAAPIVFVTLVTFAAFLYPGYSHITQAVSELGGVEAKNPLIQNINFFLLGVLILAFAVGLHQGIDGGRGSKLGPVLMGFFGVSSGVANAVLPCDAGCEFQSLTGTLHNVTGLAGFLAAIVGMFVISRRLGQDLHWRSYQRYTLVSAAAALISLLLWIGVAKAAGVGSVNGVLQRLFIGVWLLWIEVTAIKLFWLSRRSLPAGR